MSDFKWKKMPEGEWILLPIWGEAGFEEVADVTDTEWIAYRSIESCKRLAEGECSGVRDGMLAAQAALVEGGVITQAQSDAIEIPMPEVSLFEQWRRDDPEWAGFCDDAEADGDFCEAICAAGDVDDDLLAEMQMGVSLFRASQIARHRGFRLKVTLEER